MILKIEPLKPHLVFKKQFPQNTQFATFHKINLALHELDNITM